MEAGLSMANEPSLGELSRWVAERDLAALRDGLSSLAAPETLDLLRELDPVARAIAFRALPREYAT
jgi:hypothetical protein